MHLYKNTDFLITRRDLLTLGKYSYLIIAFTKRKVGAHLAMPIKGNVHLLLLVSLCLKPTVRKFVFVECLTVI